MKIRCASCTIVLAAALALGAPAWAAKVKVCHVPPGNPSNFHTITISDNALQAHLAHGDLVGECFAHCGQLCDDGNACTIDACDETEHCAADHPPVSCDDGNLCTIDSCDPTAGCLSTPRTCSDSDLCTVDSCDPLTGECVFPPNACPSGQTCNPENGSCENEEVTCPCSGHPVWEGALAGEPIVCSVGGNNAFVQTETGVAEASSSPGIAVCGAGSNLGVIFFPATPEEGAVCIDLIAAVCGPDD